MKLEIIGIVLAGIVSLIAIFTALAQIVRSIANSVINIELQNLRNHFNIELQLLSKELQITRNTDDVELEKVAKRIYRVERRIAVLETKTLGNTNTFGREE